MLDKYLQNKKYQKKYKMNKGDLVIMNNFKLAHGRTKFSVSDKKQRNLLRVWLEK
jgi:alpha-ketoglutarate-dependent taurine dioxygenase